MAFRRADLRFGALAAVLVALAGLARADGTLGPAPTQRFADDVEQALSRDGLGGASDAAACPVAPLDARVHCLLALRYQGSALALALRLYDVHGNVAGVERAHFMDGGFRGEIRLVPAWPTRASERHLAAILRAHDAIEATLSGLRAHGPRAPRYRHRAIVYRFCRSVRRTTPSAYAGGWSIGYNLSGSLNHSDDAILTTITHEIFHLNDEDEQFAPRELRPIHAAIVARCGSRRRCLAPYSPTATTVRGGTYYSFQRNNGDAVAEYGAELASRYLQEQRSMLEHGKLSDPPFKCATHENAESYAKIGTAYFGGVDLTPSCPH